jgi:ribosomal protein L37AE/L43A
VDSMRKAGSEHNERAWLVLAAGDDRQHGGNDGYDDDPASHYSWDSTVPHSVDLAVGDRIVLWDKQVLLGASVIERISSHDAVKSVHRCPNCHKASIKERRVRKTGFKCFECGTEFDLPETYQVEVTTYRSGHEAAWTDLLGRLTGAELREVCYSPKSQHSLRPLDWGAFRRAVAVSGATDLHTVDHRAGSPPSGHRTTIVRARRGQGRFRRQLLDRFGSECAFTGPSPEPTLEACHLYSYAELGDHHEDGGLLLRRDLHRLFDVGDLAVDPRSWTIDASPYLRDFAAYGSLQGRPLRPPLAKGHERWLKLHWKQHREI